MASGRVPNTNRSFATGSAGWLVRLLMTVCDAALGQIVGGKFQGDAISGKYANAVATEFTCKVGQYGTVLVQLNAELTGGKLFYDRASNLDAIFFTHCPRKTYV